MIFLRRSEYIPAVAKNQPMDPQMVRAATESLISMHRISRELLQKAVQDMVHEQAEALRRDPMF